MKILLDENISYRMVKLLSSLDLDSLHVSGIELEQSPSDIKIWVYAKINNLVIFSFDEDFHQLSNIHGFPPKVVLFRFGNTPTKSLYQIIETNLSAIQDFSQDLDTGILEIF